MKKTISVTLIIISILLSLTSCSRKYDSVSQSALFFDTFITITIYDTNLSESRKNELLKDCIQKCEHYDQLFSITIENSDIYRINHSNGSSVTVDEETIALLKQAVYYASLTEGKIDPTIASVKSLWDFHTDSYRIPTKQELFTALTHVDYTKIFIEEQTVTLTDSKASIDLGFIAKGYIADQLIEYLKSQKVTSAWVNLGGNIAVIGSRPNGYPFQIGIQYPFSSNGEIITALQVSDASLVTSGIYERYFMLDNTIYHHILDTTTGYPVQNNLLSVSILSSSSLEADALSTTCFVLGQEDGMKLIESLPGVEAVFVTSDYCVITSSGLE